MFDLIIIGGGPCGLTAAIYALRQGLDVLLVTKEFGGQMAKKEVEIENYPGLGKIAAADLIAKFKDHAGILGVKISQKSAKEIKKNSAGSFDILTDSGSFEAKAVLVATGSDPRHLGVQGEAEFLGKGVCYCATCDAPLFSGKDVAVVGGGNAAFESAIFCARYAKKIYILEAGEKIMADAANQKIIADSGKAQIITSAKVLSINGDKFVKSLTYQDISAQKKEIAVEGVFVKVGYVPVSGLAAGLADLNIRGEIIIDKATNQTKTPGLFAAGDVTDIKYKQIIIACGQGAQAILSISDYLKNNNLLNQK